MLNSHFILELITVYISKLKYSIQGSLSFRNIPFSGVTHLVSNSCFLCDFGHVSQLCFPGGRHSFHWGWGQKNSLNESHRPDTELPLLFLALLLSSVSSCGENDIEKMYLKTFVRATGSQRGTTVGNGSPIVWMPSPSQHIFPARMILSSLKWLCC